METQTLGWRAAAAQVAPPAPGLGKEVEPAAPGPSHPSDDSITETLS